MTHQAIPAILLAQGLNALGAARSLGVAGVPVWAVVRDMKEVVVASRFSRAVLRAPGEPLPAVLNRLQREFDITAGVLIACGDESAAELAAVAPSLDHAYRFAGPNSATVNALMDKRCEIDTIRSVADCLPRSVTTIEADPTALQQTLGPHIIFKPRTQRDADELKLKNRVTRSREDLERFLVEFQQELNRFVAQEVIPGADDAIWQCNAVFDSDGTLNSAFTFRKLGMAPPHFGVTTLGQSIQHDGVIALVRRIGAALRYTGPAGFEFKEDARDGTMRYIEINPRSSMTNWFDTRCGVNTVYCTYRVALGTPIPTWSRQRHGTYFVDVLGDAFSRLVDDAEPLRRVATRYVRLALRPKVFAYWYWRDPLPSWTSLRHFTNRIGAALARRRNRWISSRRQSQLMH